MNFWQHSSRDPAPARPATRLLVRWLQINGLEAHGCEDASFAFLNTGCDPEQIALVEAEHFSGSSEAAAELRSQAKCVVDLTQRGRVFSGVCSGDNGHRQPLPESYSGLVRVSMNGLKAGHKAACEAGLLCNGTLRQWRDVVVPGLQLRGRDEDSFSQEAQLPPEAARRGALLYFAGSTPTRREGPHTEGANLRETLRQRYAREPGFNFSRLEGAEYRRALANAEFCLAPLGMHGGWGSRWKHAVMMGCIPVMMDEGTLQPLEPLFPKDTYGVALSYADVDRLPAILRSISREERLRKRRALAAMRPYAMWTQNVCACLWFFRCALHVCGLTSLPHRSCRMHYTAFCSLDSVQRHTQIRWRRGQQKRKVPCCPLEAGMGTRAECEIVGAQLFVSVVVVIDNLLSCVCSRTPHTTTPPSTGLRETAPRFNCCTKKYIS